MLEISASLLYKSATIIDTTLTASTNSSVLYYVYAKKKQTETEVLKQVLLEAIFLTLRKSD